MKVIITKEIELSDNLEDYEFFGTISNKNRMFDDEDIANGPFVVARHKETRYWRFFHVNSGFLPRELRVPEYFTPETYDSWIPVTVRPVVAKFEVNQK